MRFFAAVAGATLMPDGRDYDEQCIHRLEEHHTVITTEHGDTVVNTHTGERVVLPPCASKATSPGVGYYSDWVVDTVSRHPSIGRMATNWTVPAAPESRGPVPGMSSVYLFNGLETGTGHGGTSKGILQPVLSYGKSGCILNPLAGWRFTAFFVLGSGRAYCGKVIEVEEGDQLQGRMTKTGDSWMIEADAGAKGVSTHTVSGGLAVTAAYITIEGMVIYNCKALPKEDLVFSANSLSDSQGKALEPQWKTEVRHGECKPAVALHGDDVTVSWGASDVVV
mmetsp:Transcript_31349/g.71574  ORF Transcript_31349/g.71574 Transcript_31349/m.71574 type:complete len:280 (-) Transcript_31349:276-1115(-)